MNALSSRRVSSVFTVSVVLFFTGIIFFIALLNVNRELIVLSAIIFGINGILKLWTRISHLNVRCSVLIDKKRLFAGDSLSLSISMKNGKFLPVGFLLDLSGNETSGSFFHKTELKSEDALLWNQKLRFFWKLQAKKRGVHNIGPLQIATGDLFGFFMKEIKNEEIIQVIVYPRLVSLKPFSVPRRDFFGMPGGKHPVHDPVYILGTADYHYSSPAKYIHWKASARHCYLQEKVFESSEQEKVLLVVDTGEFAKESAEQAFERTLEAAASMTVHFKHRGSAVGFASNGVMAAGGTPFVSVSRARTQIMTVLEAMAGLKMEPREPLVDFLIRSVHVPAGTTCVCFTYKDGQGAAAVSAHFRRRRIPVVLYNYLDILSLRADPANEEPFIGVEEEVPAV